MRSAGVQIAEAVFIWAPRVQQEPAVQAGMRHRGILRDTVTCEAASFKGTQTRRDNWSTLDKSLLENERSKRQDPRPETQLCN